MGVAGDTDRSPRVGPGTSGYPSDLSPVAVTESAYKTKCFDGEAGPTYFVSLSIVCGCIVCAPGRFTVASVVSLLAGWFIADAFFLTFFFLPFLSSPLFFPAVASTPFPADAPTRPPLLSQSGTSSKRLPGWRLHLVFLQTPPLEASTLNTSRGEGLKCGAIRTCA